METKLNALAQRIDTSQKSFWKTYVALFCVMFLCFAIGFLIHGRGFIWSVDGLEEQYMFFLMQGEWLRQLLANIFINHSFVVPQWTETVGYGADYYISIGNTFGNPINWISVFATAETADFLLELTVPITLGLAGFFFLKYCLYKQFDRFSSLLGCMGYVFSGFSFLAFTQIYMLYVLLLGSLILWGIDKIFNRESPVIFVVGMSLAFFYGVSEAYNICLLLLVYCLVRVFTLDEHLTVKSFFTWAGKVFACICLSVLIAGVMFYPNAMAILSQDRLGLERPESILYSLEYYLRLFSGFVGGDNVGEDCSYGFAPIAFIAVAGLFLVGKTGFNQDASTKRMVFTLRFMFVVMVVFLCLPFVGKVFNGFAYPNNRWAWMLCLLVGVIVAYCLPAVQKAVAQKNRSIIVASVVYVGLVAASLYFYNDTTFIPEVIIFAITLVVLYVLQNKRAVLNTCLVITAAVTLVFVSCSWGTSYQAQIVALLANLYTTTENPTYVMSDVDDNKAAVRYDSAETVRAWRNGNIANGMQGCSFYNSLYNSAVDEYHTSLGLVTSSMNFSYSTLNSRTPLELMAGTKYFIVPTNDTSMLPTMFNQKVAEKVIDGISVKEPTSYSAYKTDTVLPLAYRYDSFVARSDFDALPLAQRQDVLTKSVVLEDDAQAGAGGASSNQPETASAQAGTRVSAESLTYTREIPSSFSYENPDPTEVSVSDGMAIDEKKEIVTIEGNTITVRQAGAVLYLNADIPANTEASFACEGMKFEPFNSLDYISKASWNKMNPLQQALAVAKNDSVKAENESKVFVYGQGMKQEIWNILNNHHLYGGKDDWMVNIGYSSTNRHVIALQFNTVGVYSFDSLGVYAFDPSVAITDAQKLSETGARDIQTIGGGNGYTCRVDNAEAGEYLYFRIPYSQGWTAIVDGQPVELQKANMGFMALPLEAGSHTVELHYATPNLATGALLSGAGLIIGVGLLLVARKRKHSK